MDMTPHFPIYLDYGATTPVDPRVVDHFDQGRTIDPARSKSAESELLGLLRSP